MPLRFVFVFMLALAAVALGEADHYEQLPPDVSPAIRTAIDGGDSTDLDTLIRSSWDPAGNPNVSVLVGAATEGATVEVRFTKYHKGVGGWQVIGHETRTVTCNGQQADLGSAEDYYLADDVYFDPGPASRVVVSYGDPSTGAAAAVVTAFGSNPKGGD